VRTKKILQETIPIILIAVMPPVWFRSDNIGGSDNLCRTALIVKVEGILLIKKKRLENSRYRKRYNGGDRSSSGAARLDEPWIPLKLRPDKFKPK
jgi:hypothetical protein